MSEQAKRELQEAIDRLQSRLRARELPAPDEDDQATGHLLTGAAIHDALSVGLNTSNPSLVHAAYTMLDDWEEHGQVHGVTQLVVMKYAMDHATPEDVAALRRWLKQMNGA